MSVITIPADSLTPNAIVPLADILKESPIRGKGLEISYTILSAHVKRVKTSRVVLPAATPDILNILEETLQKVRWTSRGIKRGISAMADVLDAHSHSRFSQVKQL